MTTVALNNTRGWDQRRLRHALDVISVLVARDLKVLYKRSFLGFGWALAQPLLQLLIFMFVFRRVLAIQIENFASFALTGMLVWTWFQASLIQGTGLITANRSLVRQPNFPLALLPHVTIGVRLFHFSLAMPLLMALLWWQGIPPTATWLALPLLVLVQFVLTAALAYPLAALNVRLRDTQHVVTVTLQLSMYLTPIFYSLQHVPEHLRPVMYLNPMVPLIEAWRDVLLRGQWPNFQHLAVLALIGAVLLVIGQRIFVAQSHRFVEEL
jgi:lipopolysaccharide transport system permease protein